MNKKMIGLVGLTGFMVAILVVALSGCAGPQVVPPASLDDQGPGEGYLQVKYQYYADNPTSDFEKVVNYLTFLDLTNRNVFYRRFFVY